MANILIAGANGLIGRSLSAYLSLQGHDIKWLVRRKSGNNNYLQFLWDPASGTLEKEAFDGIDVLINLAGSPIAAGRWTQKRKADILNSRIQSIQTLREGLDCISKRPTQIIQASAIGYYGHRPGERLTETGSPGSEGFLCQTTRQWESEANSLKAYTQTLTIVRTGLYLHPDGGVWPKLIMTLPFRILNYFGNGNQIYSWIHHEDYQRAIEHLIQYKIEGAVNLTAPNPVSNKELINAIKAHYPWKLVFSVPSILLQTALGEMSSLLLDSCNALPEKLVESSFQFQFHKIEHAVSALLKASILNKISQRN
ncbi:MAG: TIGR01777 family protein [Saprospiraceae bacterium]|nr:TIGR01777 family protein [Saprospiraceae bacterium]